MRWRDIDPAQWVPFAETFSRGNDGRLVTLYAEWPTGVRECIARAVPFRGVAADLEGIQESVAVMIDSRSDRHTVPHPARVILITSDDGAEVALSIRSESGSGITTEFETAGADHGNHTKH